MHNVIVIGGSLAGLRCAEGLRRGGYAGAIHIVGAEPARPYDRTMLSKEYLTGAADTARLELRQAKDLDATWHLSSRAVHLDTSAQRIELTDGRTLSYDGLAIATGASPRQLPGIDHTLAGVHTLRTLADAEALRSSLVPGARIVIIGAGFIGTELASACVGLGLDTSVVTPLPVLWPALGDLSPAMTRRIQGAGVALFEGTSVIGLDIDGDTRCARLSDGTSLPADIVVVAVGAVPAIDWLEGSGIKLDNGVVCDETLAVLGLTDVVAAGDVARWPHPAFGGALVRLEHFTNVAEQGLAAGKRLATGAGPAFAPVPSFWSDQFGLNLQGVGVPSMADTMIITDGDADTTSFVAEFRRDDQLVGAVTAGQARPLLAYRKKLAAANRYPTL